MSLERFPVDAAKPVAPWWPATILHFNRKIISINSMRSRLLCVIGGFLFAMGTMASTISSTVKDNTAIAVPTPYIEAYLSNKNCPDSNCPWAEGGLVHVCDFECLEEDGYICCSIEASFGCIYCQGDE